jgi:hypothetical protein
MRKDRDVEDPREAFVTQCLAVIVVALAWLVIGVASQKGYLPR